MNSTTWSDLLAAFFLGFLVCLISLSLWDGGEAPINGALSAAATLVVGWGIQKALRRQGILDRVSIDYIATVNKRIDELVLGSLSVTTNLEDRLTSLSQLANEIHWLVHLARSLGAKLEA